MITDPRSRAFRMILDAARDREFFKKVFASLPFPFPPPDQCPALYATMTTTTFNAETNRDYQNQFSLGLIQILHVPTTSEKPPEYERLTAIHTLEDVLHSLRHSQAFRNDDEIAHLMIDHVDPLVISLAPLGINQPVAPPFYANRFDIRVDLHYSTKDT